MIRLGLAITTIGRPVALEQLLRSAAESTMPPAAVAIANQSGGPLGIDTTRYPFPVTIRKSSGGSSAGRNDAVRDLPPDVTVLGFPNDDSFYPPTTLARIAQKFDVASPPVAIACAPLTAGASTRPLPDSGTSLDRTTVWRAIEWCMFVQRAAFVEAGGFRTDVGTGSNSLWQSGEGTDLLLRFMSTGRQVVSAPEAGVCGMDERRQLSDDAFVAKHRRYARGTGFVYRVHHYPMSARLRIVVAPWLRLAGSAEPIPLALRIAYARSVGRVEGLLGRTVGAPAPQQVDSRPASYRES